MVLKLLQRLVILGGNALAAFMDFGVGALISSLAAIYFGVPIEWHHLLFGGMFALFPDMDLLPPILSGKSAKYDHRQTLFHRPLLILPIASSIGLFFGGHQWAVIAFLCVLGHYCHDTDWTANRFGIAWAWPFSYKYWSLRGSFEPFSGGEHHYWLVLNWLQPTRLSIFEAAVGIASLAWAMHLSNFTVYTILISLSVIVIGIASLWFMSVISGLVLKESVVIDR